MLYQQVRAWRNQIKYGLYSKKEIYNLEYMTEKEREEQVFYLNKII
jgi:hypothetical protein